MPDIFMHNLFIAVETEVVVLSDKISLGYAETLSRSRTLALAALTLSPTAVGRLPWSL